MVRHRLCPSFFFFLVASLVAGQWSTAHIHLPSSHGHGDIEHRHAAFAHSHFPLSHHEDIIDAGHGYADQQIIDFNGNAGAVSSGKLDKRVAIVQFTALLGSGVPMRGIPPPPGRTVIPHTYLDRSTVRLRAPPA